MEAQILISSSPLEMFLQLLTLGVGISAIYLNMPTIKQRYHSFQRKYRLNEDWYLLPIIVQFFKHFVVQSIFTKRFSLWYEFEENCKSNPKKLALNYPRQISANFKLDLDKAFEIEQFTYDELYHAILRMSYILKNEFNVQKGDIVTLYYMNKPIFIMIWLALWNLGAIPAFLNYNLTSSPLVHCIKIVNANLILVDDECQKTFNQTADQIKLELPNVNINILNETEMMSKVMDPINDEYREQNKIRDQNVRYWDPAVLVYTSGTTGLPKSAVNSWRKCFSASHLFPRAIRIKKDSNVYTAMPIYHGTASILGVLPVFIVGGTISIGHKFSLSTYWTQVKLCHCNTIQYVGEVCRYLVDSPTQINENECFGKIRLAYGNGLRPDIWLKLKERFGIKAIGEFYASSESPFATTCYEHNGIGVGAIRNNGFLVDKFLSLQYTLAKTDPSDDNTIYRNSKGLCEKPKPGENGEMVMRILNPNNIKATFPGYMNNDQATYSKIIKDVFKKGDAWVRSDDIMKFDDIGCIYFVDRMGDTFRWKSENVSTTEVENIILENMPEIKNCVVIGAKVDNHEGRCGYALVETVNGNNESIEERCELMKKLAQISSQHLPHYARPCFARFESIELTENHKISKKRFRDPVLPNGVSGEQEVFYLDQKNKTLSPLNKQIWDEIITGKIRL